MEEDKKDAARVGAYGIQGRRHLTPPRDLARAGQVTSPPRLDNHVREPAEPFGRTPLRESRSTLSHRVLAVLADASLIHSARELS